jgi:hypothetical protein
MTPQCDDQILGHAWLGKDESISRAQPIEAKTPGLCAGKRRDFPHPSAVSKSPGIIFHFYQSNPFNRLEPFGSRAERTFHENQSY